MDIFLIIDDENSDLVGVGITKNDMREVLISLAKSFADANSPLAFHVQYHNGDYGEFIIMIATNKISPELYDLDLWQETFTDYLKQLSPDEVESFKIGRFLNLN